MAQSYIEKHPSKNTDLNAYGEYFSVHIDQLINEFNAFSDFLYLTDLALLEWIYNSMHYADDNKTFDITNKKTEQIVITLSPSLTILKTSQPIFEIWSKHKNHKNTKNVRALEKDEYLIIYRKQYNTCIKQICINDWLLLKKISTSPNMQQLADFSIANNIAMNKKMPQMIQSGWLILQ